MIEEQGVTSRTLSTRPETPSECSTMCVGSLSTKTKLKVYQSCVMSALLYGSECWRMIESDITKPSVFHTMNLRRILQIFCPDTISNQQLLARCIQDSMETIIIGWRWRWIGHVMRREHDNITCTALHWIPEESARGEDQETPGTELWRQSSTCHTA